MSKCKYGCDDVEPIKVAVAAERERCAKIAETGLAGIALVHAGRVLIDGVQHEIPAAIRNERCMPKGTTPMQ